MDGLISFCSVLLLWWPSCHQQLAKNTELPSFVVLKAGIQKSAIFLACCDWSVSPTKWVHERLTISVGVILQLEEMLWNPALTGLENWQTIAQACKDFWSSMLWEVEQVLVWVPCCSKGCQLIMGRSPN